MMNCSCAIYGTVSKTFNRTHIARRLLSTTSTHFKPLSGRTILIANEKQFILLPKHLQVVRHFNFSRIYSLYSIDEIEKKNILISIEWHKLTINETLLLKRVIITKMASHVIVNTLKNTVALSSRKIKHIFVALIDSKSKWDEVENIIFFFYLFIYPPSLAFDAIFPSNTSVDRPMCLWNQRKIHSLSPSLTWR